VGGVQMDGSAAEGTAPFHHRAVVMRVGDRDAGEPAERLHDLDGGGIDERDAVPQNIAFGSAQDERALADREFRHRPDPDQAGLVLLIAIEVPAASASRVVHLWPPGGTNCRSSSQIGQDGGGASEGVNWLPQVSQMKAGMTRPDTLTRC